MAIFSQKYGQAEKLTTTETVLCWGIPIVIGFVLAMEDGDFSYLIFGVIGGAILTAVWRGRKHRKAERAFLNDLKARGVKPKITNVTLSGNLVTVNVEDYGEFWTVFPQNDVSLSEGMDMHFKRQENEGSDNRSYKCIDVSWTDDTVTLTYLCTEGAYPYREMTFEKTYSVFKEVISWRRVA